MTLTAKQAPHFAAHWAKRHERFAVQLSGRYTADPRTQEAKVTSFEFSPGPPERRRRELESLRRGFETWWAKQWAKVEAA